jgi:hypothetical protein
MPLEATGLAVRQALTQRRTTLCRPAAAVLWAAEPTAADRILLGREPSRSGGSQTRNLD